MKKKSSAQMLDQIKKKMLLKTDVSLAQVLDVSPQTLSNLRTGRTQSASRILHRSLLNLYIMLIRISDAEALYFKDELQQIIREHMTL